MKILVIDNLQDKMSVLRNKANKETNKIFKWKLKICSYNKLFL